MAYDFIQPGKPAQEACIERFKRTCREEVLDLYLFGSLAKTKAITKERLEEYNAIQPHETLGDLSPCRYTATVDHWPISLLLIGTKIGVFTRVIVTPVC